MTADKVFQVGLNQPYGAVPKAVDGVKAHGLRVHRLARAQHLNNLYFGSIICKLMDFITAYVIIVILLILFLVKFAKWPTHKTYGIQSITSDGREVRSYSEKILADYFQEINLRYQYEPGLRGIYANPDFYLPDYDVYVEYWGLLEADDPYVKSKYENHMKRKMAMYYENKIKFISIYPKNLENLDWIFRKKFENVTGRKLPH